MFPLWEAFAKHHFLLRGPIQNSGNEVSLKRNGYFSLSRWKKNWTCSFDVRIPMPKPTRVSSFCFQTCHKHFGSFSKLEIQMEALCLQWKLRAHFRRLSLVPPWDLSFWAKAIGFHLLKTFHVESTCWVPATTKRLLNFTLVFCARSVQVNIKKLREDVCARHVLAKQDLL